MKYDLHIHSELSDGQYSIDEILELAKIQNLAVISITDHNIISSIANLKLSTENHLQVIEGIEISSYDRKNNYSLHFLGYSRNFDIDRINRKLKSVIDGYNLRAKNIIDKLNIEFKGLSLKYDEIILNINGSYISRNFLAYELVRRKVVPTIKDGLKECFVKEDNSWMLNPEEAISLINEAGGVAIWAHPGHYLESISEFETYLQGLIKIGLQGIEVYYPKHSDSQITALKKISQKYGLVISGGSDWHGDLYLPKIKMGCALSDQEFKKIDNLLSSLKI